jgi:hypothetical protein
VINHSVDENNNNNSDSCLFFSIVKTNELRFNFDSIYLAICVVILFKIRVDYNPEQIEIDNARDLEEGKIYFIM